MKLLPDISSMFIVVHWPVVSGSQEMRHLEPSLKILPGAGSEGDGSAKAGSTKADKAIKAAEEVENENIAVMR